MRSAYWRGTCCIAAGEVRRIASLGSGRFLRRSGARRRREAAVPALDATGAERAQSPITRPAIAGLQIVEAAPASFVFGEVRAAAVRVTLRRLLSIVFVCRLAVPVSHLRSLDDPHDASCFARDAARGCELSLHYPPGCSFFPSLRLPLPLSSPNSVHYSIARLTT